MFCSLLCFRGIPVDLPLLSGIFLGTIQGEKEERVSVTRRPNKKRRHMACRLRRAARLPPRNSLGSLCSGHTPQASPPHVLWLGAGIYDRHPTDSGWCSQSPRWRPRGGAPIKEAAGGAVLRNSNKQTLALGEDVYYCRTYYKAVREGGVG